MSQLKIFLCVLALSSSAMALDVVYTDLLQPRIPSASGWREYALQQDHSSWPSNQKPRMWTNLTFAVPYWADVAQVTATDEYGSVQGNEGAYSAQIPYLRHNASHMNVSFAYWGVPLSFYVGFSN